MAETSDYEPVQVRLQTREMVLEEFAGMTMTFLQSTPVEWVRRADMLGTLLVGWHAMRQHRRMHRVLVSLSRMPPRLLRDMGLDPERVYEKLDGTWDEVGPAHLSRLLRDRDAG